MSKVKVAILLAFLGLALILFAVDTSGFTQKLNVWECDRIEVEFSENVGQSFVTFHVRDWANQPQPLYDIRGNQVGASSVYRSGDWVSDLGVPFGVYYLHSFTFGDGSYSSGFLPYRTTTCYDGTILKTALPIITNRWGGQ